jgi:hypothetical protein
LLTGLTGWEDLEAARRIIVLTGTGESQRTRTRRVFGLNGDGVTSGFSSVSQETGSQSPAETGFGLVPNEGTLTLTGIDSNKRITNGDEAQDNVLV